MDFNVPHSELPTVPSHDRSYSERLIPGDTDSLAQPEYDIRVRSPRSCAPNLNPTRKQFHDC